MPNHFPHLVISYCLALGLALASAQTAGPAEAIAGPDGIVKAKSAYSLDETVDRLIADIEGKGIMFFLEVDQTKLAADAGIELRPSTLLIFGNPALGSHFITARAEAGLDWPVRLLVTEDETGQVWTAYSDFAWIAARHGITNRAAEFAKATEVIGSITASVAEK